MALLLLGVCPEVSGQVDVSTPVTVAAKHPQVVNVLAALALIRGVVGL
jgi:hypothetical protein